MTINNPPPVMGKDINDFAVPTVGADNIGDASTILRGDGSNISGIPGAAGTVTSVAAGNGLDFTSITTSGSVTMGTPSALTSITTDAVTATSHTHSITTGIADTNIIRADGAALADDEIVRMTANGIESRTNAEMKTQLAYLTDVVDDTTPELGGNLDMNQFNLDFDPTPSTDHTWNGKTATYTAGENLTIGELCYLKSDGKFWLADADAVGTTKGMLAIATASISADAAGVFLLWGFFRDDTFAYTVAADLYVSVTPGVPTETAPSATGDQVRIVGQASTADIIFFNPDNTYIEVA